MPVAYDSSSSTRGFTVTSLTTPAFAIGSGSNRVAVVGLYWTGNPSAVTGSVGGASCAAVSGAAIVHSGGAFSVQMLAAVNPASGTQTATASWTGAFSTSLAACVFTGAHQTTPTENGTAANQSFGTSVSATVSSASGDMTTSVVGTGGPDTAASTNQTLRATQWGSLDTGPGSGNTTHTWTDTIQALVVAACNVKAVGGAPPLGGVSSSASVGSVGTQGGLIRLGGVVGSGAVGSLSRTAGLVLDATRRIDWSLAGAGVIPNRQTIYTTLSPGASSAQINAAIAACPPNQVVRLAAGNYNLGSGILIEKSNITLRGAGPRQTFITFGGGLGPYGPWCNICAGNGGAPSVDNPGTVVAWTGGYAKGTTTVTLGSVAGLSLGMMLILDQLDDSDTDTGEIWVNDNLASSSEGGAGGRPGRCQQHIGQVTSIVGNQVTFAPGLYMPNWRSSQQPQAWWINPLVGVGIEDMYLEHSPSSGFADSGFLFMNARACWVKNVTSLHARRNHVYLFQSARITIRDSYFYGSPGTSQSYGIETRMGADHLIENNIFQKIASPMMNGNVTGAVWGYNYALDDDYQSPPSWQQASSYFHDAGVDNVLFEGNDGIGWTCDNIHGTQHFGTAFRNYWFGKEPGKTQQTTPIIIMACNRYMNLIGNVLGEGGFHSNYESTPTSANDGGVGGRSDVSIYSIGWSGNQGGRDGRLPNDVLVKSTMFRWGNYDVVNAASRFVSSEVPSGLSKYANPVPADQVLPPSFYLSAPPPVFQNLGVAWPSIGPDVTGGPMMAGHVKKIPARLCFEAGTFTSGVLNFDASFYYPQGVTPLTGVSAQGFVGAISVPAGARQLTGVSASGAVGALSLAGRALTGVAATGAVGRLSVPVAFSFAQFLAADDREPIVLAELQPAELISGFSISGNAALFGVANVGALRNNFTGCVGLKFTALVTMAVTHLGRYRVPGNAQTHTLRLMQESANGTLTTIATATYNAATGVLNAINYVQLSPFPTLIAGNVYHVYSSETNGGDQWYDDQGVLVVPSGVAGSLTSAFQSACGAASYATTGSGPNRIYGPVGIVVATTYVVLFPRCVGTADIPGGIYRRVDFVQVDATVLARGTSGALAPGEWWYDEVNELLYVRTPNDASPEVSTVAVHVTLFAATTGIVLDQINGDPATGVYYRPWLVAGVSSVTDQAPDPIFGGNVTIGGTIELMNEQQILNKLFAIDGTWRWRNQKITLLYGGRTRTAVLPRSQYLVLGTALMTGVGADE